MRGGLIVSALYFGSVRLYCTPERSWFEPWPGIALFSWARHFTLTVPLSTQVYKWVPAKLLLGITLRWTQSRGGGERAVEILLVSSCYRKRDRSRPDGPLGSAAGFTYLLFGGYINHTFRSFSLKIGCTANGKIQALDAQLFVNGGNSMDVSEMASHYWFYIYLSPVTPRWNIYSNIY